MRSAFERDPATGLMPSFASLLALFFPSVTGFMAGSNRSALLRDPGRSIPRGTLGAIATTAAVYLLTVWMFGTIVANATLKHNKLVMAAASWPHSALGHAGTVVSALAAAMQALGGATQVLNAILLDRVLPISRWLPSARGPPPRRLVCFTLLIARCAARAAAAEPVAPRSLAMPSTPPAPLAWLATWT